MDEDSVSNLSLCRHKWDYDPIPLIVANRAIRFRQCAACGVKQTSNLMTGNWETVARDTSAKAVETPVLGADNDPARCNGR